MTQFYLENRHLFQDQHDPLDAARGERLYQLFPKLQNNIRYQKKLYPEKQDLNFAAGKSSKSISHKIGGDAYNLIFPQQNEEDNHSYQRNSRLKDQSTPSYYLPKIEKYYQTPGKNRHEENPIVNPLRGYGHQTNFSHNFDNNYNSRGIKTFEIEQPRGRFAQFSIGNQSKPRVTFEEENPYSHGGKLKRNVTQDLMKRDDSSEKPITRQNEPLDIIKHRQFEPPVPYRHGLEKQAENRLIYWPKNGIKQDNEAVAIKQYFSTPPLQDRRNSRKDREMAEKGPSWAKEPVFKITDKNVDEENLMVSTFPHDDYQSLKRKLGLRSDSKGNTNNPLASEKKHLSFNRQARLEQLESLRDRRNVSDALERRLLMAADSERKEKLRALLNNE